MKPIIIFIAVTFISFLGSVHPGPVNLSVIQTALTRGKKPALLLALGGSLPEIFYATIAISGLQFLQQNLQVFEYFRWAVIPLLAIMGLVLLLNKPKEIVQQTSQPANYRFFSKGLALSFFNPQILPYWLAFSISFQSNEWLSLETFTQKTAFVIGTSTGAYLLNALYAYVAYQKRASILQFFNVNWIDKFTGISLLAMAIWQFLEL